MLGCGPEPISNSPGEASTTGTELEGTTAATPPPAGDSTGALEPGSTSLDEGAGSTGVSFLETPDVGRAEFDCDIYAQDCPAGQKCTWWANDGGGIWNDTRCVPVVPDPLDPGEPCMVEGSATTGLDDCRLGAWCFGVDSKTNVGVCHPLCTGSESAPVCEDPDYRCNIFGDGLSVCVFQCSPLAQDCGKGQGCYAIGDEWACAPDASGTFGGYGSPCEFVNGCDPGYLCLNQAAVPGCESVGCCSDICDLNDPVCLGEARGLSCQPWDEDPAPDLSNVGVCALPL